MTILSYPRNRFFVWLPMDEIPNKHGFRFIARRNDGLQVVSEVFRDKDGFHWMRPGPICDFKGWREMTEEDMDTIFQCEFRDYPSKFAP